MIFLLGTYRIPMLVVCVAKSTFRGTSAGGVKHNIDVHVCVPAYQYVISANDNAPMEMR